MRDRIGSMLFPWRRHSDNCKVRERGRDVLDKCRCPLWCDGHLRERRFRQSLKTRDLKRAYAKIDALEDGSTATAEKTLHQAVAAFFATVDGRAVSTQREYRRVMRYLEEFAHNRGITALVSIDLETLDAFRLTREIEETTWRKELEVIRLFFRFCAKRKWLTENPAEEMETPKPKPRHKEPYSAGDIIAFLKAAAEMGRGPYERLRAVAIIQLLRYTALRISDVSVLARDRVKDGLVHLHTLKTGQAVWLPIPPDLVQALDDCPVPRGTIGESRYFFWSGNGSMRAVIRDVTRTVRTVFVRSKVPGAHAHRFRHSMATKLLELGWSTEDVATILGNSSAMVRKHYAQWSAGRQARIIRLMLETWKSGEEARSEAQTAEKSAIC